MKSVLLATDLIKTVNGDIKVLETNTSALLGQKFDSNTHYLDNLFSFIQDSGFTTVHCIYPINSHHFADKLQELCGTVSVEFVKHPLDPGAVTVPYIEDSEDILIIRISYDTTAIIDEDYCKDKFKLQTLINNKFYGSKTYIPEGIDDFGTMSDFTYTNDIPNFIVKKRYPSYDREQYPKLYKIQNLTELNVLKSSIESDCYVQEFHHSELIQGKRCIIRSLDLLYGGNLDVLNVCSFYKTVELAENQWSNTFDENGLLAKKDRPKYISHTNDNANSYWPYVYDVDQEVVMGDNTRKTFSQLQMGDSLKTVHIEGLGLDERTYKMFEWEGSYNLFVQNIQLKETTVTSKIQSPPTSQLFLRVTLNDGTTQWDDVAETPIMVKNNDVISFRRFAELQLGDEVVTYNFETNSPEVKNVQTIDVVFKEDQILGSLDVEPEDVYMPLVSQYITIIQHNFCNKGCKSTGCADPYYCGDCSPVFCTPQK